LHHFKDHLGLNFLKVGPHVLDSLLHDSVRLAFAAGNSIRFTRARLAIRENRPVPALESRSFDQVFNLSKRVFLHRIFAKNRRELETPHLVPDAEGKNSIVLDAVTSLAVHGIQSFVVPHFTDPAAHRNVRGVFARVFFNEGFLLRLRHNLVSDIIRHLRLCQTTLSSFVRRP